MSTSDSIKDIMRDKGYQFGNVYERNRNFGSTILTPAGNEYTWEDTGNSIEVTDKGHLIGSINELNKRDDFSNEIDRLERQIDDHTPEPWYSGKH